MWLTRLAFLSLSASEKTRYLMSKREPSASATGKAATMPEHTDNSEALRLADELDYKWQRGLAPNDGETRQAAALLRQQAERIAELEAERDQHKHTATSLIALLADIRKACGDNGKRMQPELVEFIGSLTAERDQLRAEVERLRADAERLDHIEKHARCDPKMDGQHVWWPTNFKNALRGPNLRGAIDHARTTHKETE